MLGVLLFAGGVYIGLTTLLGFENALAALLALLVATIASILLSAFVARATLEPVKAIWQAVIHINPDQQSTPAPNLDKLQIGRELVNTLVLQIYQLASRDNPKDLEEHRRQVIQAANIVSHMPLPLFVFNKDLIVTNASNSAMEYCQLESSELFGKALFENLRLEFPDNNTLDAWIASCQENKVTDTAYWERVHVLSKTDNSILKQCDIAAFYNRDNASGTEFIVTLFDRTNRYDQDDDALGFVAMAVHELRTPITMLRGYIEALEEELEGKLDEELTSFVKKMDLAAKNLSSFVSNILNVARIDQNQLSLHLVKESWPEVLRASMTDIALRAKVQGKTIDLQIDDDLPEVAADRVSLYEVLNNLIENAVKYSGTSTQIIVKSTLNQEGLVETTVQDFGTGIPTSVMPNLFQKFSRNHRTRSQVSGTGLGLFLSKAIITAHSGNIWASSKEGEGSTFGFTLQPYERLAHELDQNTSEITRSAHGWIKNHSMYRK